MISTSVSLNPICPFLFLLDYNKTSKKGKLIPICSLWVFANKDDILTTRF